MPTIAQLYDAHAPALYAFLLSITRNEADTRDLLQEIFVRIAKQPALLADVRNHSGFLLRLAHNLAIDQIRGRATYAGAIERFTHESLDFFLPEHDSETESFRISLASALADLPEEQRAIVHLKLWETMTFAEIAELLSIPANTAASRYRYAIEKLRRSCARSLSHE